MKESASYSVSLIEVSVTVLYPFMFGSSRLTHCRLKKEIFKKQTERRI